jgi:tRNA A37 N6-isopentenylltransferase MiaA
LSSHTEFQLYSHLEQADKFLAEKAEENDTKRLDKALSDKE